MADLNGLTIDAFAAFFAEMFLIWKSIKGGDAPSRLNVVGSKQSSTPSARSFDKLQFLLESA